MTFYDPPPPQHEEVSIPVNQDKPTLVLYSREGCPFCKRVISYLEKEGKTIEIRDIGKSNAATEELISLGGKKQVPCLLVDEKPLYESLDIIEWLKNHPDDY